MTTVDTIDERFADFHASCPEFWDEFQRMAFAQINAGRTQYSSKTICQNIRDHRKLNIDGELVPFRFSNDFTSRYADLFHRTYPEHTGFFVIRRRKTD